MDRQSIADSDLLFLISGFLIGTALMLVPSAVIAEARQDAWLALFMGMLPSLFLVNLLVSLQKMFPGKSLIEYSRSILGPVAGKVISGLFLWFALHLATLVLRNIGDFIQLSLLPFTPTVVIHTAVIVIGSYAVKHGLAVISRTALMIVPVLITFLMLINILITPDAELTRLLPFMEGGLLPLVKGAISPVSFPFGESVIFAMVLCQMKSPNRAKKFVILGLLMGFAVLDLAILDSICVIGVNGSMRYIFPALEVIGEAPSSDVLEIILTIGWYSIMFLKLILCYFAFACGLGQWISLQDYRVVVLPVGVIIVALSILVYPNAIEEIFFAGKIWPVYAIPMEYLIPLLLWSVARFKLGRKT